MCRGVVVVVVVVVVHLKSGRTVRGVLPQAGNDSRSMAVTRDSEEKSGVVCKRLVAHVAGWHSVKQRSAGILATRCDALCHTLLHVHTSAYTHTSRLILTLASMARGPFRIR